MHHFVVSLSSKSVLFADVLQSNFIDRLAVKIVVGKPTKTRKAVQGDTVTRT